MLTPIRLRVERVHRVLGVDERADAAAPLRLGDHVVDERRLARRLGAEDLDDPPAREPADAEREVERERSGGDRADRHLGALVAHPHDGALAEVALDLASAPPAGPPRGPSRPSRPLSRSSHRSCHASPEWATVRDGADRTRVWFRVGAFRPRAERDPPPAPRCIGIARTHRRSATAADRIPAAAYEHDPTSGTPSRKSDPQHIGPLARRRTAATAPRVPRPTPAPRTAPRPGPAYERNSVAAVGAKRSAGVGGSSRARWLPARMRATVTWGRKRSRPGSQPRLAASSSTSASRSLRSAARRGRRPRPRAPAGAAAAATPAHPACSSSIDASSSALAPSAAAIRCDRRRRLLAEEAQRQVQRVGARGGAAARRARPRRASSARARRGRACGQLGREEQPHAPASGGHRRVGRSEQQPAQQVHRRRSCCARARRRGCRRCSVRRTIRRPSSARHARSRPARPASPACRRRDRRSRSRRSRRPRRRARGRRRRARPRPPRRRRRRARSARPATPASAVLASLA